MLLASEALVDNGVYIPRGQSRRDVCLIYSIRESVSQMGASLPLNKVLNDSSREGQAVSQCGLRTRSAALASSFGCCQHEIGSERAA